MSFRISALAKVGAPASECGARRRIVPEIGNKHSREIGFT
jgi:hypothetical protein